MNNNFSEYSDKEAYRIANLIAAYVRGTITEEQHRELDEWVAASDDNLRMFERLTDEKNLEEITLWMETVQTEKALQDTSGKILFKKPASGRLVFKRLSFRIAASVILIAGLFIVLKPFSKTTKKDSGNLVTTTADIAPGGNKAILTLSDGRKIILDSAVNGELAKQGSTSVTKSIEGIAYTASQTANAETLLNSISTPRGGQYKLTLADGSQVWLNAESSIQYPVNFTGNERLVTITGEAYFEVAPSISLEGGEKKKPFKVKVNDAVVEVLGTRFNVNAYVDEPVTRIMLAEGSVKVSKGGKTGILKPGQEAAVNQPGDIAIKSANLQEALAWKNGQFFFDDAPIETIMRQVARWYDAEIIYKSKPGDNFNAELSRDVPVSKLLRFLELTNQVHFRIENKKIIVSE